MPTFATTYRYTDDSDTRDAVRPDHRAYLGGLTEAGSLLVSGPLSGEPAGALLVFEGDTEQVVRALVDGDPFVQAGLVAEISVREWATVSGRLAPQF